MVFYPIAKEIRLYQAQKTLWRTTSDLKKIQQKKLRRLLEHAYTTVPFYHKKFSQAGIKPGDIRTYADLKKIPLLTKTELKTAGDSILSRKVAVNNCVLHQTSGSTGFPLKIYFTKKDNTAVADISYERVRRENGYHPCKDVFMEITGSSFLPQDRTWYQKFWPVRWYKLNILQPVPEQVCAIQHMNPDVIWGYPSAIKNICDNVKFQGISGIHPRLVFTASEVLSHQVRHSIENILDTEVLDVYGAHETGCIAWECGRHEGYHLSMDTNIVEFLDNHNQQIESDESGRVIVTNLHSFAMPLIRYEIGDSATPAGTACSCGRGGYMIKSINGRNDDFITLPKGKMLSPMAVIRLMHKYDDILCQFKLVQETEETFTFYMHALQEIDPHLISDQLENDLKSLLGENAVITIISVNEIPREGSLKLRAVISKITKS